MPWKECDPVSLREEFCVLAAVEGSNLTTLCERFGISRKTGYKWLARWRAAGPAGLLDRSRRPRVFRSPTPGTMEGQVLEVRAAHPAWGGRKIRAVLARQGLAAVPSASTITAILRRHGLIDEAAAAQRRAFVRFERSEPNELWQMDFKGEFRLANGQWCYPLTVLDDHSRFSLVLRACDNQRTETVQSHLTGAFRRYGLPWRILSDNGGPWGVPHVRGGYTRLGVWLLDLDVALAHGRPYHPQTQGKDERFHRTLKLEVLQGRSFADRVDAQRSFDPWREVYNHQRPHEALDLRVPATRYRVSQRAYPERLTKFDYDTSFTVRRVSGEGRIVFRNRAYYLARAFAGRYVGIRATAEDGRWAVCYRSFPIIILDEAQGVSRRSSGRAASARYARESSPAAEP